MPSKPFTEKSAATQPKSAAANSDKSEFEDSVNKHLAEMVQGLQTLKDLADKGKPEKDESAEKLNKDTSDIQKATKDSKDSKDHKHEKSEKERKELIKEGEVGGIQSVAAAPNLEFEQRIAALESAVGHLLHFIRSELRPDLSKGALKQEPDQPPQKGARSQ